jgi:hypothetical protein
MDSQRHMPKHAPGGTDFLHELRDKPCSDLGPPQDPISFYDKVPGVEVSAREKIERWKSMSQCAKSIYFWLALQDELRYQDEARSRLALQPGAVELTLAYEEKLESKMREPLERQKEWFPNGYQLLMVALEPGRTMGAQICVASRPPNWPAEPPWKAGDAIIFSAPFLLTAPPINGASFVAIFQFSFIMVASPVLAWPK